MHARCGLGNGTGHAGHTLACQLDSRHSTKVLPAIIALLRPHQAQCKSLTLTLTFVNDKKFSEHEFTTQCLKAKVYFEHPYYSWERGLKVSQADD